MRDAEWSLGCSGQRRLGSKVALVCAALLVHAMLLAGLSGGLPGQAASIRPQPSPPIVQAVLLPSPTRSAEPIVRAPRTAPAGRAPPPVPRIERPVALARSPVPEAPDSVAPSPSTEAERSSSSASRPADPADRAIVALGPDLPDDSLLGAGSPAVPASAEAGDAPGARPDPDPQPDSRAAGALQRDPGRSAPPLAPPSAHSRSFRVHLGDYTSGGSVARLRYWLEIDGEQYRIRTEGEAQGLMAWIHSGLLVQTSVGIVGPQGLMPLRYTEARSRRGERAVGLDQQAGLLRPSNEPALPLPPGTQDRLSVFYQLGILARAWPERFFQSAVIELPVATLRVVRTERFEVLGDEVLELKGAAMRSLRLRRMPVSGRTEPMMEVWLGYDFEMLPVRLRVEDAAQRVLDQIIDQAG